MGTALPVPQIILPVGISFYTFKRMTYSIDLYRREVKSAKSLLHFAAYVSMFSSIDRRSDRALQRCRRSNADTSRPADWIKLLVGYVSL